MLFRRSLRRRGKLLQGGNSSTSLFCLEKKKYKGYCLWSWSVLCVIYGLRLSPDSNWRRILQGVYTEVPIITIDFTMLFVVLCKYFFVLAIVLSYDEIWWYDARIDNGLAKFERGFMSRCTTSYRVIGLIHTIAREGIENLSPRFMILDWQN